MSVSTDQLQAPQQLDQPNVQQEKAKQPIYKRKWFIALAAVFALGAISSAMGGGEDAPATADQAAVEQPSAPAPEAPADPAPAPEAAAPEAPAMTVSQENAVEKAESYLDLTGFSRSGLIDQLEFEGFTTEDATFAVEYLESTGAVDWNAEAVEKAESYMDLTAFSRSGLIEQLEFEGFTTEQANYAADQVGL